MVTMKIKDGSWKPLLCQLTGSDAVTVMWQCRYSMMRIGLAPCSPFTVTNDLMRDAADLARRYEGVRLHTHLAENQVWLCSAPSLLVALATCFTHHNLFWQTGTRASQAVAHCNFDAAICELAVTLTSLPPNLLENNLSACRQDYQPRWRTSSCAGGHWFHQGDVWM